MNDLTPHQKELLLSLAPVLAKSCAPLIEVVIEKRVKLFMQFIFDNATESKEQSKRLADEFIVMEKRIAELEQQKQVLIEQHDMWRQQWSELTQSLDIRDLEQQANGLEEMLDVTDTWSVMNTYAITVDDIYEQMQELRKQAAKLKEHKE